MCLFLILSTLYSKLFISNEVRLIFICLASKQLHKKLFMSKYHYPASIREIPYNHTSYTDSAIIERLLGKEAAQIINRLREHRETGRSARMLFEVLGDIWAVKRNPYLVDDLLKYPKRKEALVKEMRHRLHEIALRKDKHVEVNLILEKAIQAVDLFQHSFAHTADLRKKLKAALVKYTRADNILFDGLSRVSHATDATDWRVEIPFVVICPDQEDEIASIVRTLISFKLNIIPRGGGTGYTGGAIPLDPHSAVINTEKLDIFSPIELLSLPGLKGKHPVIHCGAGVVTRRVEEAASQAGYVFAVDPTSADASCIGGNVAMNAGGKKAVLWGTTLDNLVYWKMVDPQGRWKLIERVAHNFGKIHDQALVHFRIHYLDDNGKTTIYSEELSIPGSKFRKVGLGKDVTDKFLSGLPGIQKEGTDGIITSAGFILHQPFSFTYTICMEFFGTVSTATPAIMEVKDFVFSHPRVELAGLEHLDWRYVRAVGYATKAARNIRPKMVLLADIAADNQSELEEVAKHIVTFARKREGEAFIARSAAERKAFWLDRSRTAAIAKHTNAFKINEDVVIPLQHLGEYSDEIERINIELSFANKLQLCTALTNYLSIQLPNEPLDLDLPHQVILAKQTQRSLILINEVKARWQWMCSNLDCSLAHLKQMYPQIMQDTEKQYPNDGTIFTAMRDFQLRISIKRDLLEPLASIFSSKNQSAILEKINYLHREVVRSRIFVALHMHAGDGNIHTNIPVNSDNAQMLAVAEKIVKRIMNIVRRLNGVISGEHGIGITKIDYLTDDEMQDFWTYKKQVDPHQYFNRGKLMRGANLNIAYTPSFHLLTEEALILEHSNIGTIANDVKNCLRCGKCKPVCSTHVPRANLLYSPRNKILALSLLTEAFLYEEQTRRGISVAHFAELAEVAEHCTLCHRCFKPCPVDIDFGQVSIKIKNFLQHNHHYHPSLPAKLGMIYLNNNNVKTTAMMLPVIKLGLAAQNLGYQGANRLFKNKINKQKTCPAKTIHAAPWPEQVMHFVNRPLPSSISSRSMRSLLNIENNKTIPILRRPELAEDAEAVFYFPGCGSERLYTQISLATQAMLWLANVQTVLPPGYLCCGYPQKGAGLHDTMEKMVTNNRVLFHRMANTLNYLDIKTVIVSCGTCYDQLTTYHFQRIFPDCRLIDIHEYLLEKNFCLPEHASEEQYIYHDPCHSPIKSSPPTEVASKLLGQSVILSDRCCGESGLFAMNRPDIASQVKFRKQEELNKNTANIPADKKGKLLTTCPACLQGLNRYRDDNNLKVDYIVIELAKYFWGDNWQEQYIKQVQNGGIEQILL